MATILQSSLLTDFLYPFLLVFFIVFAVLEKTKILGEGKQINAFTSLVIGLIFVSAVFPKLVVENLILYLSVGFIVIFVSLMIWGFITGKSNFTFDEGKKIHKFFLVIVILGIVFAVIWATGLGAGFVSMLQGIFTFLFDSSWSGGFWTNFLFVFIIAFVIAIVLNFNPFKDSTPYIKP